MFKIKYGSKYGAKKQEYNGYHYMSKKEARYAQDLDLLIKAKEIKSWVPQFKLSLDVNGHHIANYFVDFMVIDKHDTRQLHEVKGFATETWRLKWLLTEALYGDKFEMIVIK